jgi:CRISPR/Cas system CMR-associated protein Cmr1 (group 7 of RAMP superfamily)
MAKETQSQIYQGLKAHKFVLEITRSTVLYVLEIVLALLLLVIVLAVGAIFAITLRNHRGFGYFALPNKTLTVNDHDEDF